MDERDALPAGLADALRTTVRSIREARREALAAYPAASPTWEYGGRSWYWPGGERLPYFWTLCDREDELLRELEAAFGLERVGVGTGRVVLRLPDAEGAGSRVVKLARYGPSCEMGDGRRQNRRERALYSTHGGYPFLPVVASDPDGDWLAMPRARISDDDDPETTDAVERVREALAPYVADVHFDELKPENVGEYDDRYWLVDYGRPPRREVVADAAAD